MIDVYTTILGGYDNLRLPEPEPGVRYLCYTDEPRFDVQPWRIQPAHVNGDMARSSRVPKILSHLHVSPDCEMSAWMDGCFSPKAGAGDFVRENLSAHDIAVFVHPRRNAFAEVAYCDRDSASLGFSSDTVSTIRAEVDRYRGEGYPGSPFVCGGVILRRENEAVRRFNELWWSAYRQAGRRDQFSLSYALWKSGIRVKVIEADILTQNPGFGFHFHGAPAFAHLSDNPRFKERRAASEARRAELSRLIG